MNTTSVASSSPIVLIPALICLLGMGLGIVAAFRKRDARIPLGIGGVAFVLLYYVSRHRGSYPMQPIDTPQLAFTVFGSVFLIAILLGGIALVVAAIRHGYIGTLITVGSVLLIGVFMAGFTTIEVRQGATVSNSIPPRPPAPPVPTLSPAPAEAQGPERPATSAERLATAPGGPNPTKIEYIVGSGPALAVPELPEWRRNPPREGSTEQGWSKYVLSSQQFATVEEAEAELFQAVIPDVQGGFAYHWPETQGWVPTQDDIVASGLITEKVIETIPLKVGEFENTVYRVSWLVEFRPETNKALHARWFPLEAERRSRWILAGLAGITSLLGGTAVLLRRQRAVQEPESAQMA